MPLIFYLTYCAGQDLSMVSAVRIDVFALSLGLILGLHHYISYRFLTDTFYFCLFLS